ncbi:MAG: two-component system response regulator [Verrucomicrobia bacterium]|nr:two-component system response regulator [Verrucomicrobiota bacterium]
MPTLRPILLAEDNPNDVELIVTALKEARLANEIVIANDGAQALDFLYRRGDHAGRTTAQPAVILLDLKMPKVDGGEVLRQIRSDPNLKELPVVVLTSSREESDLLQSYEHGVNAYVVKPVDFEEFTSAVAKLGFFWALLNELPPEKVPGV